MHETAFQDMLFKPWELMVTKHVEWTKFCGWAHGNSPWRLGMWSVKRRKGFLAYSISQFQDESRAGLFAIILTVQACLPTSSKECELTERHHLQPPTGPSALKGLTSVISEFRAPPCATWERVRSILSEVRTFMSFQGADMWCKLYHKCVYTYSRSGLITFLK